MPFSAGPRPPRGFAAGVRPSPATNVRVTERRQESYQFLTDAENTTIGELRSTNVGRDNITIMYNYRLQTPILRDILEHAGPAQERDILAHLPGVHPRGRPSRGEGNGWASRNQPPPAPPWHQATSPSIPRGIAPPIWSPEFAEVADQKRLCISIEFGITSSTVAFCSPRINNGVVQQIIHWPGTYETLRKIPTCLIYDEEGRLLAWGLEAYSAPPIPRAIKCEHFKLFLEPRLLSDESAASVPHLPTLPPGKMAIDLIIDYLGCIYEYSKEQITRENGAVADLDTAEVWITIPAAWNTRGSEIMREAAIKAGLVYSSRAGDTKWRDRLKIISEPEAALTYCVNVADLHHLRPSQNIMVCNSGEGVVDLSIFKITGKLDDMEVAEVCTRSLAECGSSYLGMQFRELVNFLLSDHPIHIDPASLAYFQFSFDEVEKLTFAGGGNEDKMFYFTCFNSEDPDDPSVGLINGQLAIPGNLLKQQVFDPVVDQVIQAIEDQLVHVGQTVHALLLVGHLGESEYLKREVERRFKDRIATIARPPEAGLGMVKGAAQFGLAKRSLVSSVIASQSYILKVDMPAEDEDWHKRPVYIKIYDSGETVCENRLEYLVTKGAIVPKGQRFRTKVCNYTPSSSGTYSRITSSLIAKDSGFVVTLYTSNSDQIMRYLDQGEVLEVCKWNVGLPSLQVLHPNATISTKPTIFPHLEIGLELDSLEARVMLTYQGQEWGSVTLDLAN
ncbi:actin-like ATPase domain-containing protein [Ephemerocybe angulata]|uniref:Actin-like ATPase domain-containing protein n=1 Tax=Ephemerocybe angulata TaxID=980116 RepID=A0A8H6HK95_9AGAR|nr:actin-like ATPase domain-containing protein [Tulosesus angulatus]